MTIAIEIEGTTWVVGIAGTIVAGIAATAVIDEMEI